MIESYDDLKKGDFTLPLDTKEREDLLKSAIQQALEYGDLHVNVYRTYDRKGYLQTTQVNRCDSPYQDCGDEVVFEIYISPMDLSLLDANKELPLAKLFHEAEYHFEALDEMKRLEEVSKLESQLREIENTRMAMISKIAAIRNG